MADLKTSLRIDAQTSGQDKVEALKKALMDVGLSADKAEVMANGLAGEIDAIGDVSEDAGKSLFNLENALKGVLAGFTVGQLAGLADAWSGLNSRLKLAAEGQEGYAQAQADAFRIAQQTRTELEATASLYGILNRTLKDLGGTQQETADLTELINKSFKISGAEASAASAAITQLSQGLASGVLRGDEFNSVMENSPRLAQALADGLGVARGQLRGLAEDGKLTSEAIVQALLSQRQAIDAEFSSIPNTIGGAIQQVENAWLKFIGEMDQAQGVSVGVANALGALAENFQEVANVALIAGEAILAAYAVKGVQAVYAYGAALAKNVAETYAKIAADREAAAAVAASAQANQAAAAATLANARAKAQSTAAAIAEAEAHLVNVRQMAIYGEVRAAAERQVTAARTANIAATQAMVAAERQLQAAAAASTAAQAAAARSAGVLSATMGLLGGPAGVIAAAAAAILIFGTNQASAKQSTDALNASLEAQSRKLNELSANQLRVYLDQLKEARKIAEAEHQVAKARLETMNAQRGGLGDVAKRQQEYNQALVAVESTGKKVVEIENDMAEANERLAEATGKVNEKLKAKRLTQDEEAARLKELSRIVPPLEQAYINLGLASSTALDAMAKKARDAYETLVANKAPIEDQRQAWLIYAQAAMQAAERAGDGQAMVTRATLEAEAAAKGYIVTISEDGEVVGQTLAEWAEGYDQLAAAQDRARADSQDAALAMAQSSAEMNGFGQKSSDWVQNGINDFHAHLQQLGEGVAFVINAMRNAVSMATNESEVAIRNFQNILDQPSATIGGWLEKVSEQSKIIMRLYQEQRTVLDSMIADLAENPVNLEIEQAALHLEVLEAEAQNTRRSINQLGQEDIGRLRAALEDARAKMRALEDASLDALSSVQDEFDSFFGNLDEMERRRNEQKLAELRAALAEAEASGNREAVQNLREAIRLYEQLAKAREKEAREEEESRRARGESSSPPTDTRGGIDRGGSRPLPPIEVVINGYTDENRLVDRILPVLQSRMRLMA